MWELRLKEVQWLVPSEMVVVCQKRDSDRSSNSKSDCFLKLTSFTRGIALSTLHILTYLNLTTIPYKFYYYTYYTGEETEGQRWEAPGQGHWIRTRLPAGPGPRLPPSQPAPYRVGVPGRPLTSPGEANGSPHWAQPLKRILVQLLSNVQMLHLGEREHNCLPVLPQIPVVGPLNPFPLSLKSTTFCKGTSNLIQSYGSVIHPNVGEVKSESR